MTINDYPTTESPISTDGADDGTPSVADGATPSASERATPGALRSDVTSSQSVDPRALRRLVFHGLQTKQLNLRDDTAELADRASPQFVSSWPPWRAKPSSCTPASRRATWACPVPTSRRSSCPLPSTSGH